MRDPCVFCSGEACPGSCRRTKKAESPTQGAPPSPPPQKQPKLVSRGGGAMSGVAQRLFQQHQRTQSRAAADPKRTLGKAEVRAHALSFVGRQARHLPEAELVAGAAHHLARLRKAVEVDNRVVAARHAHAYSIYERLLGNVPSDEGSAAVSQRCLREGASLVKSEAKTFEAFRRDEQVRETALWSEALQKATGKPVGQVRKALPAPDPQGPKIPKPPVAGAPIAAERKAKFGNKTSATAPTAAPTPKPPSMPTKATTKAPTAPRSPSGTKPTSALGKEELSLAEKGHGNKYRQQAEKDKKEGRSLSPGQKNALQRPPEGGYVETTEGNFGGGKSSKAPWSGPRPDKTTKSSGAR